MTTDYDYEYILPYLPEQMQIICDGLNKLNNTPFKLNVVNVLAVANFAASINYDILPPWSEKPIPISEFFTGIVSSGGMKSTTYKIVSKSIQHSIDTHMDAFKYDNALYQKRYKKWETAIGAFDEDQYNNNLTAYQDELQKNPDSDTIKPKSLKEIQDSEPKKPINPLYFSCETATLNGVIDSLMNSPFLMFFSAEAGNFLHGHSFRDGGMKLELGSAFSRLWDEGAIEKKIASTKDVQGTIKLRNRRMSMLLLFQASVGGSLFRDAKLGGQGFLQRFLLVQVHNRLIPPDPDWSKEGRQKMKDIYKTFDGFHNRIGELLFKPEDVELKLPVLTLTDDATVECSDYRQNCNERIALDVDENRVSYIARLPEHALRLAGTLAVFRGHDVVDSGDMSVGIYLAEMFRQERYGLDVPHEVKGIDYVKEAERLIEAIKGKGLVEFEMKDINTGFGWFRSHQTSDRHKILEEAEEKELIEVKSQSVSTGGRSKTVYKLIS